MTDSSGLTPQQEVVRRLLAEARHDGPVPPEVVTRLEETLASLVSERAAASPTTADRATPVAPVVDLGARRRRAAGIGLLAAAAVVVAGVAIGQGLPRMEGSGDAGSSVSSEDSGLAEAPQGADDGSAGAGGGEELAPESLKSTQARPEAATPTLSAYDADLDDKLLALRPDAQDARAERRLVLDLMRSCDLEGIGRGDRLVVRLDGETGVVVFRRPDGASQQADLYACGTPVPVRTLSLPAP
jgi:hypothetical protein